MKRKGLLKTLLLLCALVVGGGSVWADYEAVYTFTIAKNASNNGYGSTYDVTIDGLNWNVPGNQYENGGLRIGGKDLDEENRVITGKSAFTEAISKITFNHGGVSSDKITVNSVTLTVASDADFNTKIDEVVLTPTIAKTTDGSFDFTPTAPLTEWASGSYYKITINVTCTDTSSNRFLLVKSIVFYRTVADKTATSTAISDASLTNTDLKDGTSAGSLSASVTAGGSPVAGATVTWSSDDTGVATIDEDGVVTLVAVGTTTITATYAGDATYYGSSNTYNLEVTDTRVATVTAIDDSGLTNTDVHTSTIGGTLTASVTASGSPVAGAIVTWESSDPTVATIDSEGNVTLVKAGSTTITATYAGGGSCAASSDTYDLTVTDSNAPLLYESVSKYTSSTDNSTKITSSNASTYLDDVDNWDYSKFDNIYPGRNGCFKFGASSKTGTAVTNAISLVGSGKLTFQAKRYNDSETGPLNITVTGATATGDISVTATGSFEEYTVFLNNATGSVVITFATESKRIYLDEIKLVKVEKENVTITSSGFATYVSDYDLNYSGLSVKAYRATVSGAAITFEKMTTVPAGEGVLLQGAGSYDVPVATGVTEWDEDDNAFVRGAGAEVATSESGMYNYILNDGANGIGFYKAAGQKVAKNRAYLQSATNAARIAIDLEDEVSGISAMYNEESTTNGVYDLQGRRVAQPTKGLYIMNGKKVIFK